jgi:outer membrane protein insertion porin family
MHKLLRNPILLAILFYNLSLFSNNSLAENNSLNNDSEVIRISRIKIEGAKAIPTKKIKESIATEFPPLKPWVKKPEFDEEILKDDMLRIKSIYANNGYYDATAQYKLKLNKNENNVDITIIIKEGEPVILTVLELDYQQQIEDKTKKLILRTVPLNVNKVFSAKNYERTKDVISEHLFDDGYPKAQIRGEALVNRKEKWAKASYKIEPGPLYRFGSLKIEGNEKAKKSLIEREVLYKTGEIYSEQKIDDTQSKIFQLGLFRSVLIDTNFDEDNQTADTVIRLLERDFGKVKIGGGFGTEDKLRGQIVWTQRDLFGSGRTLQTSAKASFITQRFQTELIQPYIIGRNSQLSTSLNIARDDVPSFEGTTLLSATTVRKGFKRKYSTFGSFNIQYAKIDSSTTRTPQEQSSDNVFLTFFTFGFDRITTDNALNPTRGTSLSVGLEPSFRALASDLNYLKGIIDLRGYKTISNIIFAKRLSLGVIQPFGSTGTFDVPVFKRFFAGGSTSMRGFPFQKLGPLNRNDDPLGGNSLLIGSFEGRYPIYKGLGGVVFFDYGNVYARQWNFKLDELKYAPGAGLRYDTIIGPIRFDVGYALNPEPGIKRVQFWISIGQAF